MDDFGKHLSRHLACCYQLIGGFVLLMLFSFTAYVIARWLIEAKRYVDIHWFD